MGRRFLLQNPGPSLGGPPVDGRAAGCYTVKNVCAKKGEAGMAMAFAIIINLLMVAVTVVCMLVVVLLCIKFLGKK